MSQETHSFEISMKKTGPMEFTTKFDKDYPDLLFDEPKRSGGFDKHPSATRVLTASIANCLSASLTFCLSKTRIDIPDLTITTKAICHTARNKDGRWRIERIDVIISPKSAQYSENLDNAIKRCKDRFFDYCIVSKSVEQGFNINYSVE